MTTVKKKDLKACTVKQPVTFHAGTVLQLTKKQAEKRMDRLEKVKEKGDLYVVKESVQFKRGEQIALDGKLNKAATFYLDFGDDDKAKSEEAAPKTDKDIPAKEADDTGNDGGEDDAKDDAETSLEDKNETANAHPSTKALANENGLDLSTVKASGTDGFITKVDAEKAIKAAQDEADQTAEK